MEAAVGVRDTRVCCGAGVDFYVPALDETVTRPGPLLRRDCDYIHSLVPRARITL